MDYSDILKKRLQMDLVLLTLDHNQMIDFGLNWTPSSLGLIRVFFFVLLMSHLKSHATNLLEIIYGT